MFVKIPQSVLSLQLLPNALKVYCYLCSCANAEGYATVSANKIAQRCNIARETVRNAAIELEKAGLLQIHRRYKPNGTYRSNGYTLARPTGRWFALEVSERILSLPASAFAVYAAFLSFRSRAGKAFPSLTRLSALLGLCRNTIIKAIRQLRQAHLVRKLDKWAGKHNLYILLCSTKKECPALGKPDTHINNTLDKPSNTIILTPLFRHVKSAVVCLFQGVVHFLGNIPLPTYTIQRKRVY